MWIEKVRVEGFRLLEDIELILEPATTVIVGRNNSGKTSLSEVFERISGERDNSFRLEDFSAGLREKFLNAKEIRDAGGPTEAVLNALPIIAVTLTMRYKKETTSLGPLSPFIIDLDAECTTAIARIEYSASLSSLNLIFNSNLSKDGTVESKNFYQNLRTTLPKAYEMRLEAIDPTDSKNRRKFDSATPLHALLNCGFVRAQRTLDKTKHGDTDVLGKLLGTLYRTASSTTAVESDKKLVAALRESVEVIEKDIQSSFDDVLKGLLPALAAFGFPSLSDTEIRPETSLDVEALLSDNTKIVYPGVYGVHLPEGYNGLGTRNLIYILLQLSAFHKAYRAHPTRPSRHLIFIEEPEAHLHPQMQEVFISQLNSAVTALSSNYPGEPPWQVQFVVSTHSPHIANAASFEAVRYFLASPTPENIYRRTKVKDFRKGFAEIPKDDRDFLHQYMTLSKCDLYFADKAILVEGPTERILIPRICQMVDAKLPEKSRLASQYITTIEVGGAHAQIFYPLLEFLELKSLIITDIDAAYRDETIKPAKWKKCPCAEAHSTSNSAIKAWFGAKKGSEITIKDLIDKPPTDKIKGCCRIAYQIPETGSEYCARSYEDALILANPDKFGLPKEGNLGRIAWELAQDFHKTDVAIRFAIKEKCWIVPKYISEGLIWLSTPSSEEVDILLPTPCDPLLTDGSLVSAAPINSEDLSNPSDVQEAAQ